MSAATLPGNQYCLTRTMLDERELGGLAGLRPCIA